MRRQHRAIAGEFLPRRLGIYRLRFGRLPDEEARLRIGHEEKLLFVESQRFGEPANQRKRRPSQAAFDVGDVAGLDAQVLRELTLSEPEVLALRSDKRAQFVLF